MNQVEKWIFKAYKREDDYLSEKPYFEKTFDNFDKMKTFSGKHSAKEMKIYKNYCSTYVKYIKNENTEIKS